MIFGKVNAIQVCVKRWSRAFLKVSLICGRNADIGPLPSDG